MTTFDTLTALSPLDGRYAHLIAPLRMIFSEYGLIERRVAVECAWLLALCDEPNLKEARALSQEERTLISTIAAQFSLEDARRVKAIESRINHDVKAVEYFIKEQIADTSVAPLGEFIHFACTSEDINNVAHALMLRDGLKVLQAAQEQLLATLSELANDTAALPMLARTHGQPASPTTLGKEMAIFVRRLRDQLEQLKKLKMTAKLNGAVGNYNAHLVAAPNVDWPALTRRLLEEHFGLAQNPLTTQIETHDRMAELFDLLSRWNSILLDLNRDLWSYISLGYLTQKPVPSEVGSSTMPHKVNPIDFENSEGNLGLANALLQHLARKLVVSRWQRDLSDSTVLRNMGVAFGYTLIACLSTKRGLNKIVPGYAKIADDLNHAWEVLAEPIQTIMRKLGQPNPYEQLKDLTRGQAITPTIMREFIAALDLPPAEKEALLALTPATYTGLAEQLVQLIN